MIKVAKDSQVLSMKIMGEFGLTAKARKKLPSMYNLKIKRMQ